MKPGAAVLVEGCATSAAEARACFAAGAGRVELCASLDVGGLTPSPWEVEAAVRPTAGPVVALVRPTHRSFRLTVAEAGHLVEEVARMAGTGVQGIVAGGLDARGRLDRSLLDDLVRAADGLPVTFHRAFDGVADPLRGIETLADARVSRVLTAGGAATAWEGRATLRDLVGAAGGAVTVLGGGGVRGDHVRRLVEETGLREVHARASAVPGIVAALG